MARAKEPQKFIDKFAKKAFGRSLTEAKEKGVCITCGNKVKMGDFKDQLSIKNMRSPGSVRSARMTHLINFRKLKF